MKNNTLKKIIVAVLLIALVGIGVVAVIRRETYPKTPAGNYMKEAGKDETLFQHVDALLYPYADVFGKPVEGFGSPMELSSEALFNFFLVADDSIQKLYNEQTALYEIPIEKIESVLSKYLGEYQFEPEMLPIEYDVEKQMLLTTTVEPVLRNSSITMTEKEYPSENHVMITGTLSMHKNDKSPLADFYLMMSVDEDGAYRIQSCQLEYKVSRLEQPLGLSATTE